MSDDESSDGNSDTTSSSDHTFHEPPPASAQYARFDSRSGNHVTSGSGRLASSTPQTTPKFTAADLAAREAEVLKLQRRTEQVGSIISLTLAILLAAVAAILIGQDDGIGGLWGGGGGNRGGGGRGHGNQAVNTRGSRWEEPTHISGRKLRDTEMRVRVTLDQLWREEIVNLTVSRSVTCPHCHGAGGTGVQRCNMCGGEGVSIQVIRMGNMVQHVQRQCSRCGGKGHTMESVCHDCGGSGQFRENNVVVGVQLTAGLQGGDTIRIPNFETHLNAGPGELFVTLDESIPPPPSTYSRSRTTTTATTRSKSVYDAPVRITRRRKVSSDLGEASSSEAPPIIGRNDDLEGEIVITLKEAMRGFERTLVHPGGKYEIRLKRDSLVDGPTAPGQVLVLKGHGMLSSTSLARRRQLINPSDEAVNNNNNAGAQHRVIEMQKREFPSHHDDGKDHGHSTVTKNQGIVSVPIHLDEAEEYQVSQRQLYLQSYRNTKSVVIIDSSSSNKKGKEEGGEDVPRGDLYVKVKVKFPDVLTEEQQEAVRKW